MSDLTKAGDTELLRQLQVDFADTDLVRREDLAFIHSLFMQCFLPVRHNETNKSSWEATNGNAKLAVCAGWLINPEPNAASMVRHMQVPAGAKARLIIAYVDDYVFRNKTREVDMGKNLHRAMEQMHAGEGARNRRELIREVENVAAAEIILGLWGVGGVHQSSCKVADEVSFWIERDPKQGIFWKPEMVISAKYYDSIISYGHIAPLCIPKFVQLRSNPRAMDVFAYLSFRLRDKWRGGKPVRLSVAVLHAMFGQDIKEAKHFWVRFKRALALALEQYPAAQVKVLNDCIELYSSDPVVPPR